MTNQKLTDRTEVLSANDDDFTHVVQSGVSYKIKKSNLLYDNTITIPQDFDWSNIPSGYSDSIWNVIYDFDLTGLTVAFPKNVTIRFNGGKLSNYTELQFDNTEIISEKYEIFNSSGVFSGLVKNAWLPEWFGAIPNDDTIDDRIAFNKTMNACNELGGGVALFSDKYWIDSRLAGGYAVEVFSNTTVIGKGMYKTLVKVGDNLPLDTPVFLTNSASNVQFSDFEIDGNKSRTPIIGVPEDEGIDIKGGTNIRIFNMHIHDMHQDAIDFDEVSTVGDTFLIDNCILQDNGGFGIHNNFSDGVVSNCVVRNNGHTRFANTLDDSKYDIAGVDIRNGNCKIVDCLIENNIKGVSMTLGFGAIVKGNTIFNNGDVGISVGGIFLMTGTSNSIVSKNVIQGQTYGIKVIESRNALLISDNIIVSSGSNNAGIYIENTDGLDISGGSCEGFYSALITGSSGYININNLTLKGTQTGVRIETGVSDVDITNCYEDISTGAVGSVDLRGLVDNVKIMNNDFSKRQGVRMLNSGGNPFNCVISNNKTIAMTVVGTGHTIKRNIGYTDLDIDAFKVVDGVTEIDLKYQDSEINDTTPNTTLTYTFINSTVGHLATVTIPSGLASFPTLSSGTREDALVYDNTKQYYMNIICKTSGVKYFFTQIG